MSILAPTLLDFGTEEQKRRHIPAILRGDELWVQFLSEPTGGSDLAGLVTRADRDGDVFVLNGSKIWSSGAFRSDYALCLARTDWHVPKHRGLTMFIVKIHQPGIEVQQIKMVNGTAEFCQEFFDDVAIPAADVVGEVNDGWTVASRLLFHERDAVGGGSPYASGAAVGGAGQGGRGPTCSSWPGPPARPTIPGSASWWPRPGSTSGSSSQLIERVTTGIRTGALPGAGRLPAPPLSPPPTPSAASTSPSRSPEPTAGAWADDDAGRPVGRGLPPSPGRQPRAAAATRCSATSSASGCSGMPREYAADRDKPFDEVRHN